MRFFCKTGREIDVPVVCPEREAVVSLSRRMLMRSILLFFEPVTERSRYGKIFRQRDGSIEEDMVDSRWKTWSIGFDVHLKTVFAAVLIPDDSIGKIQRFVVKYDMEYRS